MAPGFLERPNGPEKRTCQNGVTGKLLPNVWKLFRSAWWSLRRMQSRYAMPEDAARDVVRRHRGGDGKEKCREDVPGEREGHAAGELARQAKKVDRGRQAGEADSSRDVGPGDMRLPA